MLKCIELAKNSSREGISKPYAGAIVLSKEFKIVGEGYHNNIPGTKIKRNAERIALDIAGKNALEGILITTHTPCDIKENPLLFDSCTNLIKNSKINTVVIGFHNDLCPDSGEGIRYLRGCKIEVIRYEKFKDIIQTELNYPIYHKTLKLSKI